MNQKLFIPLLICCALVLTACQSTPQASAASRVVAGSQPVSLQPGQRVRGELTSASALNYKDGSRYALYRINLQQGDAFRIELSGSLEGTLALYNDLNELLISGSPLHFQAPERGRYLLAVSGKQSNSFGPFNLLMTPLELSSNPSLVVGEAASGWLEMNGFRSHTLQISERGYYQIDLRSSDFDTLMLVTGPGGYRAEDDDGGDQTNSRIGDLLQPGEYQVRVSAFETASGLYTLEVQAFDIREGADLELRAPVQLSGWMRQQQDVYRLHIEQAGEYLIEMQSAVLDSFLLLEGANHFRVEDDDSGENLDARLLVRLEPGEYRLTARDYNGGSGGYQLIVQQR
ncbi:hypothetical protein [Marinospirillum alkaliphilum]|uniref:Pre-peptidase C-terminal domain-containing protein n=1 Tax=Marinospirillum alkaliphilum DSM 21637 TaxID=1122209 RepID=A0A1K1W1V0_9GAMM|nr:hypothetical protein [Marinospirillum alkaliphilum]SFX30789.1 hypothetical protein SAMN02745752_01196 [Marinospirillum alkaliphilum DSM 21637]